jgi:hypothetical protein
MRFGWGRDALVAIQLVRGPTVGATGPSRPHVLPLDPKLRYAGLTIETSISTFSSARQMSACR